MLKFEDVLAGCLKNDNKCKEVVYKSFYGYLMGVILRYVTDKNDAQELINDSFIKVFKSIGQFGFPKDKADLQKAFKGWIAKISSRTAIDFLRSRRTYLYVDDMEDLQQPLTELNAVSQLNVQDIMKLLGQLPETHKLIFNMYEIEGFSHDEISKLLNIPESSSRVYLTRAKNKLRTLYSKSLISSYESN
ncbi:RNA polymerase sigma-70 factor, ECF subfamily [Pedobacter steynii]|jgi:RNA polymerase sigma factor (sigma-70 family)|uniref:RNA polymerase sigma-70 factor, ECF subfamily n=1 Tax=Pedobacter steynii TaxID=430522 RepID=A0A1H0EBU9_9SPHI|nr:sigma-70 family RNA polymerase sigma factor [Pedobacter steynii]NQX41975.1 sigma-70 family RNA polymerase sigma factor [Pedobacter steynii]SDN79862.1 RNA polymerase sigma-70 factor, ECF subfamily [Pedobacter steynii]